MKGDLIMNKTKISALILSVVMALPAAASAASFPDMPADPKVATAIENAVKNGLINGYDDGTVQPDKPIRRSEMAAIITRACKVTKEGDVSGFIDVPQDKNNWVYQAMSKAYEMNAFAGDGNRMNPDNNITVQECFTVISRVFDLLPPYTRPYPMPTEEAKGTYIEGSRVYDITCLDAFSDAGDVARWAIPYVSGVISSGGWEGVDGKIIPTAYITRAQFATVMNNLIQNYIDEPGTYTELPDGNTLIRCDGVVLENVSTDDDLYIGDSVSPNGITVNNIDSKGKVVIRGCATPQNNNGTITFGDVGIVLSGKIDSVRVIRPYINLNMSEVTYEAVYGVPDANISLQLQ